MNRRKFLQKALHIVPTLPIAGTFLYESLSLREYYDIDLSKAVLREKIPMSEEFLQLQQPFQETLGKLERTYNAAYHKSHEETSMAIDSDGNPHFSTETVWEWEEPSEVLSHEVIYNWKNKHEEFFKKSQGLLSKLMISQEELKALSVQKKHINRGLQGWINTILYGGAITALLRYDHIIDDFSYSTRKNEEPRLNLRSFFKIGAASSGSIAAYAMSVKHKRDNARSHDDLTKELKNLSVMATVTPENAFSRYFSLTPQELLHTINQCIVTSRQEMEKFQHAPEILDVFNNVVLEGKRYHGNINKFFYKGVPKELGIATNQAYLTNYVNSLSSAPSVFSGLITEGLALLGVMGAVLVPAEMITYKGNIF